MAKIVRIVRTEYQEWRMNIFLGKEDTAYYTTDLDDAVYTAIAEYGEDVEIRGSKQVNDMTAKIMLERRAKNASKGN